MNSFQVKQLAELCRPVVKFLQDNYSPHETVIITDSGFKMTSDVAGMPFDNPYKDENTSSQLLKMIDEYFDKELERKRREKGTPFDNMVKRMIERSRV